MKKPVIVFAVEFGRKPMLTLMPLNDAEYATYLEQTVADYAAEHVKGGRWSAEEALEESRKELERLLPQGPQTPNQFLYTLTTDDQTPVGLLWYELRTQSAEQIVFIYDIEIKAEHRRQGFASQALAVLEAQAIRQGASKIQLHVFGHNQDAWRLYKKLGFAETNILMTKSL
jgi:ribosomal protein S18 acetylase RimI-like enzyme